MFVRRKENHHSVIHVPGCPALSTAQPKDLVQVENVEAAFSQGFEMCGLCSPLRQKLQEEEEDIGAFCRENGISYVLCNKYIAVSTPLSQWRIALTDSESQTKLYHRNTIRQEPNIPRYLTHYHDQNISFPHLLPYFQYILHHDNYRLRRPLPDKRKAKPPKKGSKRYHKYLKEKKNQEKSRSARKVVAMIDSMQAKKKSRGKRRKTG